MDAPSRHRRAFCSEPEATRIGFGAGHEYVRRMVDLPVAPWRPALGRRLLALVNAEVYRLAAQAASGRLCFSLQPELEGLVIQDTLPTRETGLFEK
jgi:hypothetical protein